MFLRISITTFEDLSNDLIYNIFDDMDYIEIYTSFSRLNKRFSTLVKDYPTPRINFSPDIKDEVFESLCHSVIVAEQPRIWSIPLPSFRKVDTFISTCCMDGLFPRLQSLTLREMKPNTVSTVLSFLKTLRNLSRLSLEIDVSSRQLPDMIKVYQMLLNFKSLKSLTVSTTFWTSENYLEFFIPTILNQQPSNLVYLVIDHVISVSMLMSIITYTPKLRHLCLRSLNTQYDPAEIISSRIPISKLSRLIKLNIRCSELTVEDL